MFVWYSWKNPWPYFFLFRKWNSVLNLVIHFQKKVSLNIGIGQGSVIGPLLFLFYIKDLPNISQLLNTILFADDTTLYLSEKNNSDAVQCLNYELRKFYNWFCSNRISVNFDKTYFIKFSTADHSINSGINVTFHDKSVLHLNHGKFLGVHFDSRISFKTHVTYISSKVSKTIWIFYKVFPFLPYSVRINLYYALFYPYLTYSNLTWGGIPQTNLQPLYLLQKKVVRLICGEHYLAHTNALFYRAKILKLRDIHFYFLCLHFHSHSNDFERHSHGYATRHRDDVVPEFQRLNLTQRSLKYAAPKAWNSLPVSLRYINSYDKFKRVLKAYIIEKYVT